MNSGNDNAGNSTSDEKSDGFGFAAAAITTLVTLLSAIIIYIPNTAVEADLYVYALLLTPIMIVSIFFFFAYIVIKGISIGLKNSNKNKWVNWASIVYPLAFSMVLIILIFISSLIFFEKYPIYNTVFIILFYITIGCLNFKNKFRNYVNKLMIKLSLYFSHRRIYFIKKLIVWGRKLVDGVFYFIRIVDRGIVLYLFLGILIFIYYEKYNEKYNLAEAFMTLVIILIGFSFYRYMIPPEHYKLNFIVIILFLVGVVIWLFSVSFFSYFTQGQVTVEMESFYSKNDIPIPVSIQVTGPKTNLSIKLSKEDGQHNLTQIDLIEPLEPDHKSSVMVSGNISANSLENGKYGLFIDTTKLGTGYYELKVTRIEYPKTDIKRFYLNSG